MSGLNLTVQVPADEWAFAKRRLTFLEGVLFQVLRERAGIQEWYDAEELAFLRLPGLPSSAEAITRRARLAGWKRLRLAPDGKAKSFYHVTSLPARAFDELIVRLLDLPPMDEDTAPASTRPIATEAAPIVVHPANCAPPWVLPLMRLVKSGGDLGVAWKALPEHLPAGITAPSVEEAAGVLVRFGLLGSRQQVAIPEGDAWVSRASKGFQRGQEADGRSACPPFLHFRPGALPRASMAFRKRR